MKSTSWFIEPVLPKFTKLAELIDDTTNSMAKRDTDTLFLADKKITALATKLKESGKLSELEWLILLRSESQYESLDERVRQGVVAIVWEAIQQDESRFSKLSLNLISGIARDYVSMAKVLLCDFPRVLPRHFSRTTKQQVEITRYLINRQFELGAKAILANGKSIVTFFKSLKMESKGSHVTHIADAAECALPQNPSTAQLTWWRSCQDLVEQDQTIEQLERLLTKVSLITAESPFEKWIKSHCLPDSKNTLWYRLSKESQLKLKSLFNVTEYKSVSNLFKLLIETSNDDSLNERQVRNLQSRIMFWSNYTDEFKRVRFFLTNRSWSLLKDKVDLDELRVQTMTSSPLNDQSEICIFDVGNYFIVERFIGSHFDLGIFQRSDEIERVLFESEYIDAENISTLEPDWVLDHLSYYQHRIARFLDGKGVKLGKKAPSYWFQPLKADQQLKVNNDLDRRYHNVYDKATYFKTGKRF
ncbi:EH signature domain-containing protein [Vibrio ezurae]|uniref:Uncharacterized protein n=1 Tax=Vibrio ezurae NBRC 102218 TaxID=1219080 RepID=U3CEP2_9VIBR|nr:EH signature domain-containing protein [Vibrio ezurae]GAD79734.1 hypothetical protein VEZ01S_20_00060 [Vibrio ezurae NBRC 102218]